MASLPNMGRGAKPLPLALIEQAIPRLSRHDLEALTERLIDRLDEVDPDPDIEPNGDELDGTGAEDDYQTGHEGAINYPGCPFADGCEDGDEDCCLASDDRGSSGPNARFPGYVEHKELDADPDCERNLQAPNWH